MSTTQVVTVTPTGRLSTQAVVRRPQAVAALSGTQMTSAVSGIGIPGPPGPNLLVTFPTGSEPPLADVVDGTLWVEYMP
jgi:hypothetical protein